MAIDGNGEDELYIKQIMAERLNAILTVDSTLLHGLLRQLHLVNPMLVHTKVECNQITKSNICTDFIGIVNSLYGENMYKIVPVHNKKDLVGFAVEQVNPTERLTVNTTNIIQDRKT